MHKNFRILGWLEGTSLLTLFFVAMPLKYIWHEPSAVRVVGMIHGLLFLAYVACATILSDREGWAPKKLGLAWLLSVVPAGTFIFDHKYLAHPETK